MITFDEKLAFIDNSCPNFELIVFLIYAIIFLILVVIFFVIVLRKIIKNYEYLEIHNKVLQRDLELNSILKHEHIQKLLCPHDLLTFNDEHIYTVDKCSMCNKQCKKACWTQYFIDKLKQGGNENANCKK